MSDEAKTGKPISGHKISNPTDTEEARDGFVSTLVRLHQLKRGEWRSVVEELSIEPPGDYFESPLSGEGDVAMKVAKLLVDAVVIRWAAHAQKTATPIVAAALRALTGRALTELVEWAGARSSNERAPGSVETAESDPAGG